jgi:hypothetical protein
VEEGASTAAGMGGHRGGKGCREWATRGGDGGREGVDAFIVLLIG